VRICEKLKPDVLVLDLVMPNLRGPEACRQVIEKSPETKVVMLSLHNDLSYIVESLRGGATGYVVKEASFQDLVKGIREAHAGQRYLSPPISETAVNIYTRKTQESSDQPYEMLTPREREILQMVAEGYSSTEIASRIHISPRTVETHRANFMHKLGLRGQAEVVRFAIQKGIVPMDR
jgi:DNA-binding NarL/FixJ family response regulator